MTLELILQKTQKQLEELDTIEGWVNALRPDPLQIHFVEVRYDEDEVRKITRHYKSWRTVTLTLLQSWFGVEDGLANQFDQTVKFEMKGLDYKKEYQNDIDQARSILEALSINLENMGISNVEIKGSKNDSPPLEAFDSQRIFIVHGHDSALKQEVARTLEHLGLKPIILHEQANRGNTIIEKFEENANVGYAIILYTQCDLGIVKRDYTDGAVLKPRARQNVVFEHGYFVARLGRNRVMAILDEGVEKPGDLDGIVYTSKAHWREELVRELKAAGYAIDANKLYV
ncbi:MAG: nucleotide-binding protein [Bacteroidales bacterium]|nr:nucleotide-binding protein [Bacteroidales bacterium]